MTRQNFVKLLCIMIACACFGLAQAQIAQWNIHPLYDGISFKLDQSIVQTDSAGTTTLWTPEGQRLYQTSQRIEPFNEGYALITTKNSQRIIGFIDEKGNFIELPNLMVAYDDPFFHNGVLVALEQNKYVAYNTRGAKLQNPQLTRIYPFSHGIAVVEGFENPEKQKNPYFGYVGTDLQELLYFIEDKDKNKPLQHKDINYLTGASDDGFALAVIKNKVYRYDLGSHVFVPLRYGNYDSEKKRHLQTTHKDQEMVEETHDGYMIETTFGDKERATIYLDEAKKPTKISYPTKTVNLLVAPVSPQLPESRLIITGSANSKGIDVGSIEVLPPQFDAIDQTFGDMAFVQSGGKWGLLKVSPSEPYSLSINNGEDVGFRHQKYKTQLRLDFPAQISTRDAYINAAEIRSVVLDKTSRRQTDTRDGNYLVYDIDLLVPSTLTEELTTVAYGPFQIEQDGIKLQSQKVKLNAWHIKNYVVELEETSNIRSPHLGEGISFTLQVTADRLPGELDYPFDLEVRAVNDSILLEETERISEMKRKYSMYKMDEGPNVVMVRLTEKGCPPIDFMFEIEFTHEAAKKQKPVQVRKRENTTKPKNKNIQLIPMD